MVQKGSSKHDRQSDYEVCERLEQRGSFVMATIISHSGSTPRISGTRMIIAADGTIYGTIGGGLLEARVMEKAHEMMRKKVDSVFMPFDLTHPDAASMDMICGGKAEYFWSKSFLPMVIWQFFRLGSVFWNSGPAAFF